MGFDEDKNTAVPAAAIADIDSADVGAAFNQTTLNAAFAAVDTKLNEVLAALRAANIIALD